MFVFAGRIEFSAICRALYARVTRKTGAASRSDVQKYCAACLFASFHQILNVETDSGENSVNTVGEEDITMAFERAKARPCIKSSSDPSLPSRPHQYPGQAKTLRSVLEIKSALVKLSRGHPFARSHLITLSSSNGGGIPQRLTAR